MKIGLIQSHIIWEDKKRNLEKATDWIARGAEKKCDFLAFPEMSFTGFSMNVEKTKESGPAESSETVLFFKELARKYSCFIGFGWVQDIGKGKGKNHYTIVDRQGELCSDYVKMHSFSPGGEGESFVPGDHISLCSIEDFTVSTFLCYDLRFPEIFQMAAERGDFILAAANWPEKRREHWISLLKARAIETQSYLAAVNCVGEIGALSYSGDSMILNPKGEALCFLGREEGLLVCEIANDVKEIRDMFPVRKDRRDDYHKPVYDCKK